MTLDAETYAVLVPSFAWLDLTWEAAIARGQKQARDGARMRDLRTSAVERERSAEYLRKYFQTEGGKEARKRAATKYRQREDVKAKRREYQRRYRERVKSRVEAGNGPPLNETEATRG